MTIERAEQILGLDSEWGYKYAPYILEIAYKKRKLFLKKASESENEEVKKEALRKIDEITEARKILRKNLEAHNKLSWLKFSNYKEKVTSEIDSYELAWVHDYKNFYYYYIEALGLETHFGVRVKNAKSILQCHMILNEFKKEVKSIYMTMANRFLSDEGLDTNILYTLNYECDFPNFCKQLEYVKSHHLSWAQDQSKMALEQFDYLQGYLAKKEYFKNLKEARENVKVNELDKDDIYIDEPYWYDTTRLDVYRLIKKKGVYILQNPHSESEFEVSEIELEQEFVSLRNFMRNAKPFFAKLRDSEYPNLTYTGLYIYNGIILALNTQNKLEFISEVAHCHLLNLNNDEVGKYCNLEYVNSLFLEQFNLDMEEYERDMQSKFVEEFNKEKEAFKKSQKRRIRTKSSSIKYK